MSNTLVAYIDIERARKPIHRETDCSTLSVDRDIQASLHRHLNILCTPLTITTKMPALFYNNGHKPAVCRNLVKYPAYTFGWIVPKVDIYKTLSPDREPLPLLIFLRKKMEDRVYARWGLERDPKYTPRVPEFDDLDDGHVRIILAYNKMEEMIDEIMADKAFQDEFFGWIVPKADIFITLNPGQEPLPPFFLLWHKMRDCIHSQRRIEKDPKYHPPIPEAENFDEDYILITLAWNDSYEMIDEIMADKAYHDECRRCFNNPASMAIEPAWILLCINRVPKGLLPE